MRVLFVSSGNTKNGISPIIKNQGESLKKFGIDVDYFTIVGNGILGYLKNVSALKNYLKKHTFQIIHAHYGLSGIVAQLARNQEKLVVSFMGDDLIGSINKAGKYTLRSNILVLFNKSFIPFYNFIIVKSKQLADILKCNKVEIIPNGVELKLFFSIDKEIAKKKLNIDINKKLIIFVANPERPEKNYILAQKSISFLNRNDIILLPVYNVPQYELKYYYSAADLLLLTSFHEGSPNVIKEAMACNCPIVATDVGDIKWIFGNTEGCFITSLDLIDIVKKINLAIEFSQIKKRTSGRNRLIELGLNEEVIAKKIINVYQKVLK